MFTVFIRRAPNLLPLIDVPPRSRVPHPKGVGDCSLLSELVSGSLGKGLFV